MSKLTRQEQLVLDLVNDSCNKLRPEERTIHKISLEGLIWNLFNNQKKYKFSLKDIAFIIKFKQFSQNKALEGE